MVETQDLDLRACAPNAQVCDTRGTEKLQGLVVGCKKNSDRTIREAGYSEQRRSLTFPSLKSFVE
jgi:hypothetical protein